MSSSLTIEDVERVAALAQIELTAEEKTLFTRQLADFLHYAEESLALDTRDVAATAQLLTDIVEGWVREDPGQWMWFHKRWNITPPKPNRTKRAA